MFFIAENFTLGVSHDLRNEIREVPHKPNSFYPAPHLLCSLVRRRKLSCGDLDHGWDRCGVSGGFSL